MDLNRKYKGFKDIKIRGGIEKLDDAPLFTIHFSADITRIHDIASI